jgi:hypothetical protein
MTNSRGPPGLGIAIVRACGDAGEMPAPRWVKTDYS